MTIGELIQMTSQVLIAILGGWHNLHLSRSRERAPSIAQRSRQVFKKISRPNVTQREERAFKSITQLILKMKNTNDVIRIQFTSPQFVYIHSGHSFFSCQLRQKCAGLRCCLWWVFKIILFVFFIGFMLCCVNAYILFRKFSIKWHLY